VREEQRHQYHYGEGSGSGTSGSGANGTGAGVNGAGDAAPAGNSSEDDPPAADAPAAGDALPSGEQAGGGAEAIAQDVVEPAGEPVMTPKGEVSEPEAAPVPRPSPVFELVYRVEPWVEQNLARIGQQALSLGADAVTVGVRAATALGLTLFGAFLTAIFFFFFCTGYGRLLEFWEQLIPERRKWRVFHLLHQMDRVIAAFVRGRLTIAVVLMVYYSVAYWIAGVPAPLVVGTVIGAAVLIPYFASVSMPVVALLLWLGPNEGFRAEWWWILGAPVVIFAIAQVVDDYILNPIIQGKATDMNTPAILFASIAGGVLAGFYGLLLAIPVAACIKILLREVFWPKFRAWAKGQESDFLPVERE
jgi:predicted PurR-regulated permease PerM